MLTARASCCVGEEVEASAVIASPIGAPPETVATYVRGNQLDRALPRAAKHGAVVGAGSEVRCCAAGEPAWPSAVAAH